MYACTRQYRRDAEPKFQARLKRFRGSHDKPPHDKQVRQQKIRAQPCIALSRSQSPERLAQPNVYSSHPLCPPHPSPSLPENTASGPTPTRC